MDVDEVMYPTFKEYWAKKNDVRWEDYPFQPVVAAKPIGRYVKIHIIYGFIF